MNEYFAIHPKKREKKYVQRGIEKISKRLWYAFGGFSNTKLFRKQLGKSWAYFIDHR